MDDKEYQRLVGLHRAEFAAAAKRQIGVLRIQMLITLLSIITVFIDYDPAVYISALLALVATFAWAYFDWRYKQHRSIAEKGRRVILLARGLGVSLSGKEYRDLLASFNISPEDGAKCEDPEYYENVGEPGYEKLAGMLQESAFWSKHLLSASASRYWSYFVVSVSLFIVLLLALIPFLGDKHLIIGAKILTLMLTLLVSNDILGRALSYSNATQEVAKVYDSLEEVKSSENPAHALLFILGDYNSAVEGAPMFASGVYERNSKRLNELWRIEKKAELQD